MIEDSDYHPKGAPLTGRKVLLILIGFFGVMLAVNFYMARAAIKTHPGLDIAHPYDAGVAYNKEIAAAKAQEALGWTVDLSRVVQGAVTAITVTVKDRDGRPVNDLVASLHFVYPATSRLDQVVVVGSVADGVYAGAAELQRGHWEVEVVLQREGQQIFRSRNTFNVE
ncbi:Nitrogen fixation protein FixH [Rhodoblastus acidophilus]|uniref:Nitrogen fixation protein FixH n=1 Tax=Rhodoblastus acidophilus TaxID=1074 RepID=A0A212R1T0_RHOAC|nr:FixH family protein [Rhodoblastus acidophilus]SNB65937.1 Nitrogen fixation protein FixH [Rhodoblastus acidophilus]